MTKNRRLAPFENGFTNTIIVADNFVSVAGLSIAKEIHAELFRPIPSAKSRNDITAITTYTITVTNLSDKIPPTVFTPKVSHVIFVADNRFVRSETPVHDLGYLTESNWMSDAEVRSRAEYTKRVQMEPSDRKGALAGVARDMQRRSGGVIVFIVVVIALTPLVLFWFLQSRRRAKTTK